MIVFDGIPSKDKDGMPLTAEKVMQICMESDRRLKTNPTEKQKTYKVGNDLIALQSGRHDAN